LNVLNKYPLIEYYETSGETQGCLNFTPTTGSAIFVDYAENSVNTTFASAHGMKNIHLINNNCTTALGCGGTASGIEVGTTNAGDSNAEYNNVALSGFNIGYRNLGTQNHFGVVFINPQIFFNGIGFQVHQVGPISI